MYNFIAGDGPCVINSNVTDDCFSEMCSVVDPLCQNARCNETSEVPVSFDTSTNEQHMSNLGSISGAYWSPMVGDVNPGFIIQLPTSNITITHFRLRTIDVVRIVVRFSNDEDNWLPHTGSVS